MWRHAKSGVLGVVVLGALWAIIASNETKPPPNYGQARPVSVTLTPQPGGDWYIYSGVSVDPSAGRHATILSITLPPNTNISLSHGSTSFTVTGGESNVFTGKPVEGAWTAQFSGSRAEAPGAITFTINWQ